MGDLGDCAQVYEAMELCLAETDRDWRKCQHAVAAVKACMAAQERKREQQSAAD